MELTLSIPALLFPAISLSMLAYNARYLAIAALIRQLHKQYQEKASRGLGIQVRQLERRLKIIKNMQAVAILSFLFSAITMFLIYIEQHLIAVWVFGMALILLIISLGLLIREIQISVEALEHHLSDLEQRNEL